MDQNIPPQFETTYEWEIENFSLCPQSIDECLRSNTFYLDSIDVSEYQLILYPRGRLPDTSETTLCQLKCCKESDFNINVTTFIAFEDEQMEMKMENLMMETGETIEFPIELRKNPLEPGRFALLPCERFTVLCTITLIYDPQIDELDLVTLSDNLKWLYRSALYSDFCLISFEGRRFRVHKMMLTTRCPKLAKKMGIVDFEDCKEGLMHQVTANALEAFLFYVYTGLLLEKLSLEVLNEILSMCVEYDMDDLKRYFLPLDIRTGGHTIIKVHNHDIRWDVDSLCKKVKENDWPSEKFIDLDIGRFVALFSVVTDDDGKINAQIDLRCLWLNLDRPLTVKCVVQVIMPSKESSQILCKGEYKFDPKDLTDIFGLNGDLTFLFKYQPIHTFPDSLALVFNFRVSDPRDSNQCNKVEKINDFDNRHPIWKRSLHKLSADLDMAFRDTYEDDQRSGMEWLTYSDLRVLVDNGPAIPAHRCILSVRSRCLCSMINRNVLSAVDNPSKIGITCASLKTVHDVLRYVYSGKLSDDIVMLDLLAVYVTSVRYNVQSLAKRCLQLIRLKEDLKHLKLLLQLSDEMSDLQLYRVVVSFIRNIKDSIENTPEWAEIMKEIPGFASRALYDAMSTHEWN